MSRREAEKRINDVPQFMAKVKTDDGSELDIHFMAIFSNKKDAIPIIMTHGWPGCFFEFLPMMEMLKKRFSEDDLP